ncbi:MAG: radical SAM protein [Sandaracinaceae bacterium]
MSRLARSLRLAARWPLYRSFQRFGTPHMMPMTMSFVLTDKCNSRCETCLIGSRYLDDPSVAKGELSTDELRQLFQSIGPLEWVTFSGGEPFMRADLPDLVVACAASNRPRVINVPTNGTLVRATLDGVRAALPRLGDTQLVLNVSVDGIGEDHDRVRGFKGNFARIEALFEGLRTIDDPRLVVGCNTVLSAFNATTAPATIDHVLDRLRPDHYVVEVAQVRPEYHNRSVSLLAGRQALEGALAHARSRIEATPRRGFGALSKAFRLRYYDQAAARLDGPREHRCFRGFGTCAVMAKGDVWASTESGEVMGQVRDFGLDFPALWRSPNATQVRSRVRAAPCRCQSSNLSYLNTLFSARAMSTVIRHAWRHR